MIRRALEYVQKPFLASGTPCSRSGAPVSILEPVHNLPHVQKTLLLATKLRLGLNVSRTRFGNGNGRMEMGSEMGSVTINISFGADRWQSAIVKKYGLEQTLRSVGRPKKNGG